MILVVILYYQKEIFYNIYIDVTLLFQKIRDPSELTPRVAGHKCNNRKVVITKR